MKKFLALFILPIMLVSCSGGGYDTSSDDDFSIKPDALTAKTVGITSNNFTWSGASPDVLCLTTSGQCYAVIYHGTINETDYVGIAVSNNPTSETLKVKIFFPAASITDGATFAENSTTSLIRVIDSTDGTYEFGNGNGVPGSVTITVALETEGEDYTTYRITASAVTLERITDAAQETLTVTEIIAIKY